MAKTTLDRMRELFARYKMYEVQEGQVVNLSNDLSMVRLSPDEFKFVWKGGMWIKVDGLSPSGFVDWNSDHLPSERCARSLLDDTLRAYRA